MSSFPSIPRSTLRQRQESLFVVVVGVILLWILDAAQGGKSPCHGHAKWEAAPDCQVVTLPSGFCEAFSIGSYYVLDQDTDRAGEWVDCTHTYRVEEASCLAAMQDYVALNPCDDKRREALASYLGEGKAWSREYGRQLLDFFAYAICENTCDCIPQVGARRNVPQVDLHRGNCQSHSYFDICSVLPDIRLIHLNGTAAFNANETTTMPPALCPLVTEWVHSPAADRWGSNPHVEVVHPAVETFLSRLMEAGEILTRLPVYQACFDLERNQSRIEPRLGDLATRTKTTFWAGIYINAGAAADFTDDSGIVWKRDVDYVTGGRTFSLSDFRTIANTTNDRLYQEERWGEYFVYHIPVEKKDCDYRVVIYLAEIAPMNQGVKRRIFHIALQKGQVTFENVDIYSGVGGYAALALTATVYVSGEEDEGAVTVEFLKGPVERPKVSALQVTLVDETTRSGPAKSAPTVMPTLFPTTSSPDSSATPSPLPTSPATTTPTTFNPPSTTPMTASSDPTGTPTDWDPISTPTAPDPTIVPTTFDSTGAPTSDPTSTPTTSSPTFAPTRSPPPTTGTSSPPTAKAASNIYINAGSSVDMNIRGVFWQRDAFFRGGNTARQSRRRGIRNTKSDALYQTERWGDCVYDIPVAAATEPHRYRIVLYLAEIIRKKQATGKRIFHIDVQDGQATFENVDIFQSAGGYTAMQLSADIVVSDGSIRIQFISGPADKPKVSGIAVLPLGMASVVPPPPPPKMKPIYINSGATVDRTVDGIVWQRDAFFTGGQTATYKSHAIRNTKADVVYQEERWGHTFLYEIPVPVEGTYRAIVHLAEVTAKNQAPQKRRFHIDVEKGQVVFDHVDIFKTVGGYTAMQLEADNVTVFDGHLTIAFRKGDVELAKCSGIEIVPLMMSGSKADDAA